MRTTLDLPENLLDEAMKITRTPRKTGVIIRALEELIRKSKIADLNAKQNNCKIYSLDKHFKLLNKVLKVKLH